MDLERTQYPKAKTGLFCNNPIKNFAFLVSFAVKFPWLWGLVLCLLVAGCQAESGVAVPTLAAVAMLPSATPTIPPTFTPEAITAVPTPTFDPSRNLVNTPTETPLPIPTNTPFTPPPTRTPSPTPAPLVFETATPVIKPITQYGYNEVIPYQAFPVPAGNNGWGMHWMPTVSQDRGAIDRFVAELVRMHIKWVVFLNQGSNIGDNDYLVEQLTAHGIMPVMRIYSDGIVPLGDDLGAMVAHYRAKGVYYFQIYNEPNVNDENRQGFANPNHYASAWAAAARKIVANGGLPGIGAFSPGGAYNHYDFLDRILRAIEYNGDAALLNHAWLSAHNYHGLRPFDDPEGFFLYRNYDAIVQSHLGRSLPIIGTEGGSYSPDPQVEKQFLVFQYSYMRQREPYLLAFSWWLLANQEGGGHDPVWEWQALFRPGFVHPAITDFFYQNSR